MIERGADVDAIDADQRSTLYILALDNRVSMACYLIQKAGADVETRDSEVTITVIYFFQFILLYYFSHFVYKFINIDKFYYRVEHHYMCLHGKVIIKW